MRYLMSVALLAICLVSAALPAYAELSIDEIIEKHIQARGGYDAIKALQSIRFKGLVRSAGAETPIQLEWQRPHKLRMEFMIQGMTIIQAFDGEQGWAVIPQLGRTAPEPMTGDQLKEVEQQADLDGDLVDYQAKGNTVSLIGVEKVDGRQAYHLQITRKNGDVTHQFIDTEHFLAFKDISKTSQQGIDITVITVLGDYKAVAGVLIPHSLESHPEGLPVIQTITLTDVEPNVELMDERFAMPTISNHTVTDSSE